MPITRKQFELEIDTKTEEWMKKIHGFLAERKDEAFSEAELREHYSPTLFESLSDSEKRLAKLQGYRNAFNLLPGEQSAFSLALERLVELGAIGKSIIRDTAYYAYRQELEKVL